MAVCFLPELFSESLDEASALFVQRCQALDPPETGLHHLLDVDNRIDAHLDLLFAGGADALGIVTNEAAETVGGAYAGTRALLRQGRLAECGTLAARVIATPDDPNRLANGEPPRFGALKAAAAHENGAGDLQQVQGLLATGGDSPLAACLAYAAGYQRWDVVPSLVAGLKVGVGAPPTWLWALGQIGEAQARDTLVSFLQAPEPEVCQAAALALCRTEDEHLAAWLLSQALNQAWAPAVLAFLGGPQAATLLSKHIDAGSTFAVIAAGLLGDGALVPVLRGALPNPSQAADAAQALYLITGLGPLEQTEVLSPPPEDGEDTPPFVHTDEPVWRLSRSPTTWAQALQRAQLTLNPGTRYRWALPAGPAESLHALRSPHLRHQWRALVIDELFVRFGLGVHLRADQHAGRQVRVLDKLEQFLPHMLTKPIPGHFTFQGRRGLGA